MSGSSAKEGEHLAAGVTREHSWPSFVPSAGRIRSYLSEGRFHPGPDLRDVLLESQERVRAAITNVLCGMISGH